jgi:hypothetical protein
MLKQSQSSIRLVAIREEPGFGEFEGCFAVLLLPRMGELYQNISLDIDGRTGRKSMQIRSPPRVSRRMAS